MRTILLSAFLILLFSALGAKLAQAKPEGWRDLNFEITSKTEIISVLKRNCSSAGIGIWDTITASDCYGGTFPHVLVHRENAYDEHSRITAIVLEFPEKRLDLIIEGLSEEYGEPYYPRSKKTPAYFEDLYIEVCICSYRSTIGLKVIFFPPWSPEPRETKERIKLDLELDTAVPDFSNSSDRRAD